MNIAYLANYQGSDLILQRSMIRNRALAGSQKIATLANLLAECGCKVQVFSIGAAAERSCAVYRSFEGVIPGEQKVPVSYQSDWDVPLLGRVIGIVGLVRSVLKFDRKTGIDAVLLYNCGLPEVIAARVLSSTASVPIVLEYEDDVSHGPDGRITWRQYLQSLGMWMIKRRLKGVVAVSPELEEQCPSINSYILRGVLSADVAAVRPLPDSTVPTRFLFAGTLQPSKGVGPLCQAFIQLDIPGAELHIVGAGPLLASLKSTFSHVPQIRFHGFVSRAELIDLYNDAHILVNPHCASVQIGAVFPFKLIEYLGTGRPVISTPMAPLEGPIASGIVYSKSDSVDDLADALENGRTNYSYLIHRAEVSKRTAWDTYGPESVGKHLREVLQRASSKTASMDAAIARK